MYLARIQTSEGVQYEIRVSLEQKGQFSHKTVFTLGISPDDFFTIENRAVIFSDDLLQAVKADTSNDADIILEDLLFEFFPTHIKHQMTDFRTHKKHSFGPLSPDEQEAIKKQIHIFDRKRLYYLRYGAVDQSQLNKLHEKCCRPLLGMSRDEKEFFFQAEEKALEPGMYMQYIFAIFNLQKFFTESYAAWMPEALKLDQIADSFIEEICQLNEEVDFWQTAQKSTNLHVHLRRYLIMFFDYSAAPRSFFDDFKRSFQDRHRSFKWPEQKTTSSPGEISAIFEMDYEELKAMSRGELSRTYRKKAMELHPDQGGSDELFIKLTNAYEQLKKK